MVHDKKKVSNFDQLIIILTVRNFVMLISTNENRGGGGEGGYDLLEGSSCIHIKRQHHDKHT